MCRAVLIQTIYIMRLTFTLVFSAVLLAVVIGQNLVPNPSFEEYSYCPSLLNDMGAVDFWFDHRGSCDYFHVCGTAQDTTTVPLNMPGYQFPATGDAYLGLSSYSDDDGNPFYAREWVAARLLEPTITGQRYYVSFKVSLTLWERFPEVANRFASDHFGVTLTNDTVYQGDFHSVPNAALFYSDSMVTDTSGWTTLTGSFISDSVYHFISVGNFFDDIVTNAVVVNVAGNSTLSYYYLDDLCLSTNPEDCGVLNEVPSNELDGLLVFPNPFTTEIVVNGTAGQLDIALVDVLGRSVPIAIEESGLGIRLRTKSLMESGVFTLQIRGASGERWIKVIHQNEP